MFAKFIELSRRKLRLTVEQLASRSGIDLEEFLSIEEGCERSPEPRLIYKLAPALGVPPDQLLRLSGLTETADKGLHDAAIRFAAQSEPVDKLTPEEASALKELVRVLAERSDAG